MENPRVFDFKRVKSWSLTFSGERLNTINFVVDECTTTAWQRQACAVTWKCQELTSDHCHRPVRRNLSSLLSIFLTFVGYFLTIWRLMANPIETLLNLHLSKLHTVYLIISFQYKTTQNMFKSNSTEIMNVYLVRLLSCRGTWQLTIKFLRRANNTMLLSEILKNTFRKVSHFSKNR